MRRPRLRAFVLSAGYGTRLEPLTLFLPKPLLPVAGEPVVGHTLRSLSEAGCEVAVLNLHHLPEAIPAELGRRYAGVPLVYSPEEEILGTLGGLVPQREILAEADEILLLNGDTLCDWPLGALLRRHRRTGADATLLLHHRRPEARYGGGVGVDGEGRVVALRDAEPVGEVARRYLFAGAHVLSPKLLERVEEGFGDIIAGLYIPLLADGGHVDSLLTRRPWHDLGTPERYLAANLDLLGGRWPWQPRRASRVSPLAKVADGVRVDRSLIEHWAEVESGARVEDSIVFPHARVASGSRLRHAILGPGVELPAAATIERRMVTRRRPGYDPGPEESVLGELVYTPLEPPRSGS